MQLALTVSHCSTDPQVAWMHQEVWKKDLSREEDCKEEWIITCLSNLLMMSLITDNRCIFRVCVSKMSETSYILLSKYFNGKICQWFGVYLAHASSDARGETGSDSDRASVSTVLRVKDVCMNLANVCLRTCLHGALPTSTPTPATHTTHPPASTGGHIWSCNLTRSVC